MYHRLLSLKDAAEWISLLEKLPENQQDVYFTPQYYYLHEQNQEGLAQCFVYQEGDKIAMYPFLINCVNDLGFQLSHKYYDIQGAYGYNGIVASTHEPAFLANFYQSFNNYCYKNNIIAGFVRFHPLLNNHNVVVPNTDIIKDRNTVAIDLTKDYERIWIDDYSSANRNMIRKACKQGYKIQIAKYPDNDEITSFINLYLKNMKKLKAEDYYFFPTEYYKSLFDRLNNNSFLFNATNASDEIVCSAVFFRSAQYFHYHLSARGINADNSATSFMIDKAVIFAKENGAKFLHLGGGRSTTEDDLLLKFKKNFSNTTFPFYIGKRIYNKDVYNIVVKQWQEKFPEKKEKFKALLLKYHY